MGVKNKTGSSQAGKETKSPDGVEFFPIDADEPVFTSGVVCRILDIPIWVLKQLDSEKVVSPPRKGRRSRLYSNRDLKRLEHVWYLMSRRHVNIDGVKVILEMEMTYIQYSVGSDE